MSRRKRIEGAPALSEQMYKDLFDTAGDVIFVFDRDGEIISLNNAFERITGWPTSEWLGKKFTAIVHPDDLPHTLKFFKIALQGKSPVVFELRILSKSGGYLITECAATPQIEDGKVTGVAGIGRDVTERRKAEEMLLESESKLRAITDSANDAFILINDEGRVTYWNMAAEKMLGYSSGEISGKGIDLIIPHRYKEAHAKGFNSFRETGQGRIVGKTFETSAIHKDGTEFPIDLSIASVRLVDRWHAVGIIRDISERKHLEAKLLHIQKLEAIGTLAGGVAHDFNNLLNAILGFGKLIQDRMNDDDPNASYLKEIIRAGERATLVTRGLLAFSRKQAIDTKPVNINDIVSGVGTMLSRVIGEDIELRTKLLDESLTVMADYGQIEQVLMNLATNARDAMPDGGVLGIETKVAGLDHEYIKAHGYGNPGLYALISVADTGTGIDERIKERIFEPFFTTKEVGKGTGLGLSIIYGIIKQHNGYINCRSELGRGTTFEIYLPMIRLEAFEHETGKLPLPKGGTETILVAEDDEPLRRLEKDVFEKFGYCVIEAVDGEDAIKKFAENKENVRLVILDVIMPNKTGKEAYEAIKKLSPGIKTIFVSGYPDDLIKRKGILEEDTTLIIKPVLPNELLRKVREVLDG